MMPILLLASASADLDALGSAVTRCDRAVANPVFSAESGRHSDFLRQAYREQEALVGVRLELAQRRRELRERSAAASSAKEFAAEEANVVREEAAIEDRQRALNDQRMLEGVRQDAMESLRRHFLLKCPAGRPKD